MFIKLEYKQAVSVRAAELYDFDGKEKFVLGSKSVDKIHNKKKTAFISRAISLSKGRTSNVFFCKT